MAQERRKPADPRHGSGRPGFDVPRAVLGGFGPEVLRQPPVGGPDGVEPLVGGQVERVGHASAQEDVAQLGRTCYGMELSPAYVDVIVKRWQEFTGKQAIHADTGQPFAEVKDGSKEAKN